MISLLYARYPITTIQNFNNNGEIFKMKKKYLPEFKDYFVEFMIKEKFIDIGFFSFVIDFILQPHCEFADTILENNRFEPRSLENFEIYLDGFISKHPFKDYSIFQEFDMPRYNTFMCECLDPKLYLSFIFRFGACYKYYSIILLTDNGRKLNITKNILKRDMNILYSKGCLSSLSIINYEK